MKSHLHLKPGQKATKAMLEQYGDALVGRGYEMYKISESYHTAE